MKLWQDYHLPGTVKEALEILAHYAGKARIIAGGTDLMIDLQYGSHKNLLGALVDVTQIPEMTQITLEGGQIIIGAAVTHTQIVKSALLEKHATCLVESCGVIGGPQVRNVATLGGNVAHALPAGDGTTSLVVLEAEVEIAWADGRREWLPILKAFKGAGISIADSSRDILVAFRFNHHQANQGSAFKRIMRPQGVALPILGCAVWIEVDEETRRYFKEARICLSPVAQVPVRAYEVEAALRGKLADETSISEAVRAAKNSLNPRGSKYRAAAAYRIEMMETLLKQALPLAIKRAQSGIVQAEGIGMG